LTVHSSCRLAAVVDRDRNDPIKLSIASVQQKRAYAILPRANPSRTGGAAD
jgi:hypothetical protein